MYPLPIAVSANLQRTTCLAYSKLRNIWMKKLSLAIVTALLPLWDPLAKDCVSRQWSEDVGVEGVATKEEEVSF